MEESGRRELENQEKKAERKAENLAASKKSQVDALLLLQKERNTKYLAYLEELRSLQDKYYEQYVPIYQRRSEVVQNLTDFWPTVLKRNKLVSQNIQEQDYEKLEYLRDLKCLKQKASDSFTLEFRFAENPYLEPLLLRKHYVMADDEVIERAEGTQIHWKSSDPTLKKKKNKFLPTKSFFNFFKSVQMPGMNALQEMNEAMEEQLCASMEEDFDIACELRDEVIPHAVLYYLDVRKDEDSDEEKKEVKIDSSGSERAECKQQ